MTNTPVFALLLLTATGGFTLLLMPVMGLRAPTAFSTRPARIGSLLTVAGAGLLVVFGLVALVTAVLRGSPLEASFIAFLLGTLLLAVGPAMWGLSLRRHPPTPGVRQLLLLAGIVAFCALAIEPDPLARHQPHGLAGAPMSSPVRRAERADPTPGEANAQPAAGPGCVSEASEWT